MAMVLVLGATGMLGSMVYSELKENPDMNVIGTSRNNDKELLFFDVHSGLSKLWGKFNGIDYVINCIGITKPYCHDDNMEEVRNAIRVNSLFPHELARWAEEKDFRIIQIATDCVFSGKKGLYTEDDVHDATDVYGKTKSLGEVRSKRFLNIRCSIIGPERAHKAFLLEWFLKQPRGGKVSGYSHHRWNGITTLQFARLCENIILKKKFDVLIEKSWIHHFAPNNSVNKYELLCLFNKIFERHLTVEEAKNGSTVVDRTLTSRYDILQSFFPGSSMEKEITELQRYITEKKFFHA